MHVTEVEIGTRIRFSDGAEVIICGKNGRKVRLAINSPGQQFTIEPPDNIDLRREKSDNSSEHSAK